MTFSFSHSSVRHTGSTLRSGLLLWLVFKLGLSPALAAPAPSTPGPDYRMIWEMPINLAIEPPVVAHGRVYTLTTRSTIQALDLRDGLMLWETKLGQRLASLSSNALPQLMMPPPPTVVADKVLTAVSSTREGHLLALDAKTGKVVWEHVSQGGLLTRGPIVGAPVVAGGLAIVRTGGGLTALDLGTGKEIWNVAVDPAAHTVPLGALTHPAVAGGIVCIGAEMGTARAFRVKDGQPLWSYHTGAVAQKGSGARIERAITMSRCSPVLTRHTASFADGLGMIYTVRLQDGKELWRTQLEETWQLSRIDDRLFAVTDEGFIQLNLRSGKVRSRHLLEGGAWACAISGDRAFISHNPRTQGGWEVFDLRRWKKSWADSDLRTFFGIAASGRVVVAAGLSRASFPGPALRYRPVLRAYQPVAPEAAPGLAARRASSFRPIFYPQLVATSCLTGISNAGH